MYDPFKNPDGSDSEYGQLAKTNRNPVQESRYQELKAQADLNDPVKQRERLTAENTRQQQELATKQRAETDARFASNKQELTDYNNEYSSTVPQVFNQVFNKYGIPTLTNAVNALRSRIQDLQGNESFGASGYANASQVDKAINTNFLPRFTNAVQALSTSMDVGQREFSNLIDPIKVKGQLLSDRIARETTAYSQQQQNELQGLLQVLQLNGNLTTAQWQIAESLAAKHLDYLATLKQIESNEKLKQQELAGSSKDRYIAVGNSSQLYDTQTGQFVTKPGGGGSGGGGSIIGGGSDYEYNPNSPALDLSQFYTSGGGSSSVPGLWISPYLK